MKFALSAILMAALFVSSTNSALAKQRNPLTEKCATKDVLNEQLEQVVSPIGAVVAQVESVPPKEAEFIKREMHAFHQTSDQRHFDAAHQNEFFDAFSAHGSYQSVIEHIEEAKKSKRKKPLAENLFNGFHWLNILRRDISRYMGSEKVLKKNGSEGRNIQRITDSKFIIPTSALYELTLCSVRLIRER